MPRLTEDERTIWSTTFALRMRDGLTVAQAIWRATDVVEKLRAYDASGAGATEQLALADIRRRGPIE